MTTKKFMLAAATAITTLALVSCASDADSTPETTTAAPDGVFNDVREVRDALSGTDYECVRWDDYDEEKGRCSFDKYTNTPNHWIMMTDDPEMLAALRMDDDTESVGSVAGESWEFDCGSGMTAGECRDVAEILGGDHIYRGYWG